MYRGEGWTEPCNGCVTAVAATKGTELSQWCTEERRPKPCKGFPFLFSTFCVFGRIRYTPPITPIKSVKLSQKHPCRRCAAAGVCLTAWSCACVCVCVCVRACACVRVRAPSKCLTLHAQLVPVCERNLVFFYMFIGKPNGKAAARRPGPSKGWCP